MKLSVLDMAPVFPGADPQAALQQAVILAQTAERLGYTRYWVSEHHDMEGLASACPEVLLAHIGANTERIRIGSGAVLLPHYKALKVAEAFHLLATLHPGRIDLGIGRAPGGSAHVTMALSGNFLENVRQLPETIQDLSDLLSNAYRLEGETVMARPIPPVPPDLWLLGTNMKSARYAARFGTGYVFGQFMSDQDGAAILSSYRREFQPSRLQKKSSAIVAVGVICAETEEEALGLAQEAKTWFLKDDSKKEEAIASSARLIIGNPQQVKNLMLQMQETYQTDEFMVVTTVPNYEQRIRSYQLLADCLLR
jgi:luciferase family oxidoreductase group 1